MDDFDTSNGDMGSPEGETEGYADPSDGSEDTENANEGDTSSGDPKGNVPYARFEQSRRQLNQARVELGQTKQQLQEVVQWARSVTPILQQLQAGGGKQQKAEPEYSDPVEQELAELRAWREEHESKFSSFQREAATAKLESEIGSALKEFPDASAHEILNGLHHNPRADVRRLAKASQDGFVRRATDYSRKAKAAPIKRAMPGGGGAPGNQKIKGWDQVRAAAYALAGEE